MRCVDVNILVYAHRSEVDRHDEYRSWLEATRVGHEPLGLNSVVLAGFIRVVTHPKVFRDPTSLAVALEFAGALRGSPAAIAAEPGARHWSIFNDLCHQVEARGNDVLDAYLAGIAIEHDATWYSADRSFARYPTLRWRHPLDA
jgi:toxin-antitoxin system PIN domain toxin